MAVTRKFLKGMGLTDEQIDTIIDAHTEVTDAMKERIKQAEEKAEKLDAVQKELDTLKAKGEDGYKEKYEKEHKAFEQYKIDVTEKETKAAKEKAARAYFESKNITGANLDIAIRGAKDEISGLAMDGDKIKDTTALDALVNGTYAGLVVTTKQQGVITPTPPANNGAPKTRDEIYKKDDHGRFIYDAAQRQKALGEMIQKG